VVNPAVLLGQGGRVRVLGQANFHGFSVAGLVAGEALNGLEAPNLQHVYSPGTVVWVRDLDHTHCRSEPPSGLPHA